MAENVTPVTLEVKDFAAREVLLVDYKFNQATAPWRSLKHPRKGNERRQRRAARLDARSHRSPRLLSEVPEHHRRQGHEGAEGHRLLLCEVQGVLGRR